MFVKTVKVKKPNPLALGIILIIVLALIAIWVIKGSSGGIGNKYKLPSNAERTEFLQDLGWDVSETETDVKVVKIPDKFNMVYTAYNKIQKQQGFDLSKHKCDTVEIYTYEVYNYPDKPDNVVAHLIICDGVLIGGDVCCTELDGFMQGLMPVKQEDVKESDETTAEDEGDDSEETTAGDEGEEQPEETETTDSDDEATTEGPASTGAVIVEQSTIG